jgi:GT2 family glycosyltransferase
MSITLSIAIPTFGREDVLIDTCAQVMQQMGRDMELLVIDQTASHSPRVQETLEGWQRAGKIRYIFQSEPSLTKARNRALQEAAGDIVLFLDDDVILSEHCIAHHLRWYEQPSIAAVSGETYNCLDPDHPPPMDQPTLNTRRHCGTDSAGPAGTTTGNNHSVRRDVALAIGGYDPRFVGSALAEDMDFCRRLIRSGYTVWYDPEAWLIHLTLKTGGCGVSGVRLWPEWMHSGNFMLYAFRHGVADGSFLAMLWQALRHGPLRKENVLHLSHWPSAWAGFIRGVGYGWKHRRWPTKNGLEERRPG